MKKRYTFSVLFLIILMTLNLISYNTVVPDIKNNNKQKVFSQRKSYIKGEIKKDSPNKFAEYFKLIKSEIGSETPKYLSNYMFDELQKAKRTRVLSKKEDFIWTSRGPGNVGGRSRGLIVDPDDYSKNTWFIAAVGGGVWKTSDAGSSWIELTKDMGSLSASYMTMAQSNHNVIYLGTGEGFGNLDALGGQGIWKSIDKGNTWKQLVGTATSEYGIINRIIVDPIDENILLVATNSGIWKSLDGGLSWGDNNYPTSYRVQQIINVPGDFSKMIASVNGVGIIKSIDSGDTWTVVSKDLVNGRIELAISELDSNVLYASAVGVGGGSSEVHVSRDQGDTWIKCTGGVDFLSGQGWYDNAIVIDPYDETTFFIGGVHIYRVKCNVDNSLDVTMLTNNYGSNPLLHKGTHVDNHYFVVTKLDEDAGTYRLLGTNDGGMCYTDDEGETFIQPNSGFVTTQFYGVDKANGKDLYIGGMQDNSCYLSPEDASSTDIWKFVFGGDGFDVIWNYDDENKVMLTSQYNNIIVTHSGINSIIDNKVVDFWYADVDKGSGSAPFLTRLAQSKQYPDLVFTYGKLGLWRTDNFGKNWNNISMPSDYGFDEANDYFRPTEIKISLADPSIVWSGSSVHPSVGMYVSKDFGKKFSKVNHSTLVGSYISGFATHPTDKNIAYALFSAAGEAKILKTTDLGQNWFDISGFNGGISNNGFPDVAVFDLLVIPNSNGKIWVGTEIGIFETIDEGVSWHLLNNGLPPVSVYDLIVVNNEVVIGTHGRGVWSAVLPELDGYEPPVTVVPLNVEASYLFDDSKQYADIMLTYKSDYDNVKVYINDVLEQELVLVQAGGDDTVVGEVSAGNNTIKVVTAHNGVLFENTVFVRGLDLKSPSSVFVTDFNNQVFLSDEFEGSGFYISKPEDFDNKGLTSAHPYPADKNMIVYLKTPIIVNKDKPSFSYKDVAIVEPGEDGKVYPNEEFWDYVTIEGSTDGQNWTNMVTPYDANFNAGWLSKYNTSSNPDKANFVSHSFKTTDFFNDGDVILVRFKLFSDQAATGWGWIIDDLQIQKDALSLEDNFLSTQFKVYPNPVVDGSLYLESTTDSKILNIEMYNLTGQLLLNKNFAKVGKAKLDISNFAKGQYLIKVETDKGAFSKKVLVK